MKFTFTELRRGYEQFVKQIDEWQGTYAAVMKSNSLDKHGDFNKHIYWGVAKW